MRSKKGMGYRGHIFVSVVVLLILLLVDNVLGFFSFSWLDIIFLILISVLYGLLPDVDTTKSRIGSLFLMVSIVLIMLSFVFSSKILGIVVLFIMAFFLFVKHQGVTHSLVFSFVFSSPLFFVGWEYFVVGLLSYTSHLIADGRLKIL